MLAVRAGGNTAAIARYERELAAMGAQPVPRGEERGLLAGDRGIHAALSWRATQMARWCGSRVP